MAAQLHLAENALALHLLLQHLKGLVDIVVTDEDLHSAFLFDRALMGPMPRRPGRWLADMHNSVANGGQDTSSIILKLPADRHRWLPIGRNEEFGSRRFLGNSSNKSVPACNAKMGAPEIKNNRRHLFVSRSFG